MKTPAIVLAAALAAAVASPGLALAQTAPPNPAPATAPATTSSQGSAAAATTSRGTLDHRVAQRLEHLRSVLEIKPDQEQAWRQFTGTVWQNVREMHQVVEQRNAALPKLNAEQDMDSYAHLATVHAQNTERLAVAFRQLYGAMTPTQQQNASHYFYQQAERFAGRHHLAG